ncbi:DUF2849 domain-containing protein [Beijerinckia sp. L45]|uniref:DUF2849 domain-containing protein n=1 Tax=Beijerinckia sp. L45 TaxID=1641855 RepID=UPI00131C491F|nr:DUF2849 domain-containing protein [Beijerinckia sp. L45]
MSKVISANMLAKGNVVFLGVNGTWVESIVDAIVFADAATADIGLLAAKMDEKRAVVVDPFIVDKKDELEGQASMTLRNAIRAFGPTIDYLPASSSSAA